MTGLLIGFLGAFYPLLFIAGLLALISVLAIIKLLQLAKAEWELWK